MPSNNNPTTHISEYEIPPALLPRFFTPYEDTDDVLNVLARPFYAPFLFTALTAIAAVVAALAFVVGVICLFVSLGAHMLGEDEARDQTLAVAGVSFLVSIVAGLLTPVLAVSIAATPVSYLLAIFTRTGTSIVSAIAGGLGSDDEPNESFGDDSASTLLS